MMSNAAGGGKASQAQSCSRLNDEKDVPLPNNAAGGSPLETRLNDRKKKVNSGDLCIETTAQRLISAFNRLIFKNTLPTPALSNFFFDMKVDTRHQIPYLRTKDFLSALDEMCEVLHIKMMARDYRTLFTKNYRALLPSDRRQYRVDVLESGQDPQEALYVNGERYVLCPEVQMTNHHFREAWFSLLDTLRSIQESTGPVDWQLELGQPLITFDCAWTAFERSYITELIAVERAARARVVRCLDAEEKLSHLEALYARITNSIPKWENRQRQLLGSRLDKHASSSSSAACTEQKNGFSSRGWQKGGRYDDEDRPVFSAPPKEAAAMARLRAALGSTYTKLTESLASLNAVTNGRSRTPVSSFPFSFLQALSRLVVRASELSEVSASMRAGAKIMSESFASKLADRSYCTDCDIVHQVNANESDVSYEWIEHLTSNEMRCLGPLAFSVCEQFKSIRHYLRAIALCPEKIDPHLSHNAVLVAKLTEFEEAWTSAITWLSQISNAKSFAHFISFFLSILETDKARRTWFSTHNRVTTSTTDTTTNTNTNTTTTSTTTTTNTTTASVSYPSLSNEKTSLLVETPYHPTLISIPSVNSSVLLPSSSFEERITALDVSAFLAVPRLVVLCCLLDTRRDAPCSQLLRLLVPSSISKTELKDDGQRTPPFVNVENTATFGHQFLFNLSQHNQEKRGTPDFISKTIDLALLSIQALTPSPKKRQRLDENKGAIVDQPNSPSKLFDYILHRCIYGPITMTPQSTKGDGSSLTTTIKEIEALMLQIEEASMTIQRTHAKEWNAFAHVAIRVLHQLRKKQWDSDSNYTDSQSPPSSSRFLDGSPATVTMARSH